MLADNLADSYNRVDSYVHRARKAVLSRPSTSPSILTGSAGGLFSANERSNSTNRLGEHYRGWVYAAIRTIAKRIAGQPIRLARLPAGSNAANSTGKHVLRPHKDFLPNHLKSIAPQLEMVTTHPFLDLINRPNDIMGRSQMIVVTIANLEVHGRAFWMLKGEKDEDKQIWPMPVPWVTPVHEGRPYSGWKVRPYLGPKEYDYKRESIVQFSHPDPNDPLGSNSPTEMQLPAIESDEAIQTAQQRAFKNGIFPGVLLTVGRQQEIPGVNSRPRLTQDQRRDIIHAVKQMYRGVLKYDEPLILDALIENVHKLSHGPREMDFLGSGRQTKARILQGYGLNAFIMGEIENANRAVAVVAEDNFCTNVVNPLMDMVSQTMTLSVLPIFGETGMVAYFEPCRANDPEMTLRERDQLIKSGSLTRDELRSFHNLPPLPNGSGNTIILMPGQALVPSDAASHDGSSTINPGGNGQGSENERFTRDEDGFDDKPRLNGSNNRHEDE